MSGPPGAGAMPDHPLARLFDPRGVAVIGASETPGKYGHILLKTLLEEKFAGGVYPVNPRGGSLLGHRFLPSLDEANGPVDVALVVRPAPEVPDAVRDLAGRGIPFSIVYAAGFSEHGEAGRRLEREMVEAAAAGGMRIVGPNCMNIFSAPSRLNLSAIVPFPTGGLGFLSASGNLGYALAYEASRSGAVGFSRFISAGNQADLALDEYLDFLRVDPCTRAILVFAEGFVRQRGRTFLEAVARTAAEKPVILLRGGRTRAGQETARSHTGALAGEIEVTRQGLEQVGAVLLDRADEALPIAQAFLESPLPKGARVALVGEGGGHATLLTDSVTEAGLVVEPLPDALVERLRPHLPPFASITGNPVEFAGASEYDLRIYEKVLRPIAEWPGCDQLVLFGGYALYDDALADFLARQRDRTGKPILVHDLYADQRDRPSIAAIRARHLPLYSSAETAARAAGALARGGRARQRAARFLAASRATPGAIPSPPARLRALVQRGLRRAERSLGEQEAADLLSHYGVPVLPASLARDEVEAVEAARQLGLPVVLKVHGAGIIHKSDVGGVHLDLRTEEEVRNAYGAVRGLAPDGRPEVRLTPYRPGGVEAIAGARRDPLFGPIILFGAGGILAEVARDTAIRALPCDPAEIYEMIAGTRAGRLLAGGFRRGAAADLHAVAAVVQALATLILALPEVSDVEVNPLRCAPDGAVALDTRVLLAD